MNTRELPTIATIDGVQCLFYKDVLIPVVSTTIHQGTEHMGFDSGKKYCDAKVKLVCEMANDKETEVLAKKLRKERETE